MPKITLTFDIPEKTESLFQEYNNIPTYQLTQHDQYAIRDLLEKTLDRNTINYKNPTENALIDLLSTVIDQQRPDDKRSFPEFVIDYIYDDIEDDDLIDMNTIEDYFEYASTNGTMTMSTQKSINYLASFWQDIEIYDELYQNVFVNAFKEGYDIVSGQRTREGESIIGSFFARCFYAFSNHSMDVQLTDGKSELRLLSKRAVDVFVSLPEYNRFNKGLYEWIGFKEKVISYKNEVRKAGKSKFGFKKSMDYAVQGIISFNDRPLRICIQFGFVSMALSLLYIIYELFKVLFSAEYTSGYFTTIAAIILFSSVQLIFIGILGEYIGKIYYEVKNRPHFIIAKSNIEQAEKDRIG